MKKKVSGTSKYQYEPYSKDQTKMAFVLETINFHFSVSFAGAATVSDGTNHPRGNSQECTQKKV